MTRYEARAVSILFAVALSGAACSGTTEGPSGSPRGGESPPGTAPPTTGPSPAAADVRAKIDVAANRDPVLLANGDIWVGHYQVNGVERVDPKSAKVVAKVPVSSPSTWWKRSAPSGRSS
jgi:hypothetical protein